MKSLFQLLFATAFLLVLGMATLSAQSAESKKAEPKAVKIDPQTKAALLRKAARTRASHRPLTAVSATNSTKAQKATITAVQERRKSAAALKKTEKLGAKN